MTVFVSCMLYKREDQKKILKSCERVKMFTLISNFLHFRGLEPNFIKKKSLDLKGFFVTHRPQTSTSLDRAEIFTNCLSGLSFHSTPFSGELQSCFSFAALILKIVLKP